jgi:hypothetical protein
MLYLQIKDTNRVQIKNPINQLFDGIFEFINVSSLKTVGFGLKPDNCLVFNCPDLKVGAINVRDIQGFSHNKKIYGTILDCTHK